MSGKFTAPQLVRTKSLPTTQLTTGDTEWELATRTAVPRREEANVSDSRTKSSASDSGSGSRSGTATRSHGLLTPHASIIENAIEGGYQSAQNSVKSTSSSSNRRQSPEIPFVTPQESPRGGGEVYLSSNPQARMSGSNTPSSAHVSYVSVGVQTSLPYGTSTYASTAPPSPISPSAALKASKRKRSPTPEYIREGGKLAQELSDDLLYLAQEKRHLKQSLARVEQTEKALKSLLVPHPRLADDAEETDIEDVALVTSSGPRPHGHSRRAAPLTPASSDHERSERPRKAVAKKPSPSSPTTVLTSDRSENSVTSFVTAESRSSREPPQGNGNGTASPDGLLRVPSYTFAEGSSVASSTASYEEHARRPCIQALEYGPNPVKDPSTYLVWFDMETTDAVRPAASIRILEVALFVTDKNYTKLDKGKSFIVHWPLSADDIACEMSERVREMHEKSGLLAEYSKTPPKERLILAQVERRICKYLERHEITSNARAIMAGAGVAFDRGMVRQHMEKLNAYFSHQIFDTTTLWHVVRRKYNRTRRFSETCVHRAMDDILESCREAKLYSELLFKPSAQVHWPAMSSQGI